MDKNTFPYFDDVKTQADKNYKEILFKPGKAIQARELTQAQSFVYEQLKYNFDTLYKNGVIVEGCDLDMTEDNIIRLSPGKFYVEGKVHLLDELSVDTTDYDFSGTVEICIKIKEEVITANDDTDLFDPANGYTNYGLSGADRLKQSFELVLDDPNAISVYTLNNGILVDRQDRQEIIEFIDILATRTNDESGSYLVNGMKIDVDDSSITGFVDIVISQGVSYVKGYKVEFLTEKKVSVPKALDTSSKLNENRTYTAGTLKYKLYLPYVEDIIYLTGTVQVDDEAVTKGVTNSADDLLNTSIASVISVVQGATTYVQGVDYILDAEKIVWQSGGDQPVTGTSYYVTYTYSKNMESGVDFTLETNVDDEIYTDLTFTGTGDLPVNGSTMLIDYSYYLARTDLIILDSKGNINIKQGAYTEFDEMIIPDSTSTDLVLGFYKLFPNSGSDNVHVVNYNYRRTTMRELFDLKKRITELEDAQAELALTKDATENDLPTELRGLYVDTFNDFFKSDTYNTDFNSCLDIINGELTLPILREDFKFNSDNNTLINSETDGTKITLTKLDDSEVVSVKTKTETENLNPYGKYIQKYPGTAIISPSTDHWIADTITTARTENVAVSQASQVTKTTADISLKNVITSPAKTGSSVRSSTHIVEKQNQYVTYAREKTIAVTGRNWNPSSEVIGLINGKQVSLVPTGGYLEGDEYLGLKTVVTDEAGNFTAEITIPPNTRSGNIIIGFEDIYQNRTNTNYSSQGIIKVFENVTAIITTTYYQSTAFNYVAPPPPPPPPAPTPAPVVTTAKTCSSTVQGVDFNSTFYMMRKGNSRLFMSSIDARNGGGWVADSSVTIRAGKGKFIAGLTGGLNNIIDKEACSAIINGNYSSYYGKSRYGASTAWCLVPGRYGGTHTELMKSSKALAPWNGDGTVKKYSDPLAQSFIFEEDKSITGIGFYFSTKNANSRFFVQVGYMDKHSGYPDNSTIFLGMTLTGNEVITTIPGTSITNIMFPSPIFIPKNTGFFISIGSDTLDFNVYTSTLGKSDIFNGYKVYTNPYLNGTMFRSANTITWESVQNKDLSFILYEGNFETLGTVETEEFSGLEYNKFMYLCHDDIPINTSVNYQYSTDSGSTWKNFKPNTVVDTNTISPCDKFKMNMILKGQGEFTPTVSTYDGEVQFMKYDIINPSYYITKMVEQLIDYSTIKFITDVKLATGTSFEVYFSRDNILWAKIIDNLTSPHESVPMDDGFSRNTYLVDITDFQEITVVEDISTLSIGDTITSDDNTFSTVIVDKNDDTRKVLLESTDDWSTENAFNASAFTISNHDTFGNETSFKGKVKLSSTSSARTPVFKNMKWVLKV